MSLPVILPYLLLSVSLSAASTAATEPIIINLAHTGDSAVLQSAGFPNPYAMTLKPTVWQVRWTLQKPAHLRILFSDLRLHPNSRLELYDGDFPAFRLTANISLIVRYESGADYWRRTALTADSGVLTVVFHPDTESGTDSSTARRVEVPAKVSMAKNADYEGFRIDLKLLHYASISWLEKPWSSCGWLQYTADSVSLVGKVWRHFDCVWVLRPPTGTKAWMRLRVQKSVVDSLQYDMEVQDGSTSAASLVGRVTSKAALGQPERSFVSSQPMYIRLRGNSSESKNHLVLQYNFFSVASDTRSFPPNCRKLSGAGFESCPKLGLCVLPVCKKLPGLSACGPDVNCSLGPTSLRSCLLRLDSQDGERRDGLRPRTLCRDGRTCVPLSVACPTSTSRRPNEGESALTSSGTDTGLSPVDNGDVDSRSSSSSSLNVVASLAGVCLAAVALIGLGFAALTARSHRRRQRQLQRHRHLAGGAAAGGSLTEPQSASSLMRVVRLGRSTSSNHHRRRHGHSNDPSSNAWNLDGAVVGDSACFSRHQPPPTPPPAYSDVVGNSRRQRSAAAGQSPPKPTPPVGNVGEASSAQAAVQQQQQQHRHRQSRHRPQPLLEPQAVVRYSLPIVPGNPTPNPSSADHQSLQQAVEQQQQQDREGQESDHPQTVRLPPLHGAC
ncbi:hypothetical protein BOX15_Mlig011631g2 [Macrostomum lignano]|uniref:CUB domain-containing protein n=1 Tax=Macrostomum lignano TaxID=282301 RepID=A0A267H7F3_9PLAT|nr:hypothetical protein BOX15_Mlig011631g2 [Macrostomum lignano]